MPTSSPTAPQEVVAEGGMPAGEGQREAPAASSAGHVAAAAAWTDPSEAAAAVGSSLPASAAAHPGQPCQIPLKCFLCHADMTVYCHDSMHIAKLL